MFNYLVVCAAHSNDATFVLLDRKIQHFIDCCSKLVREQDKKLQKTYANMFEGLSVNDDEEVFTDDTDHPNIVLPQRKLEKASSIA